MANYQDLLDALARIRAATGDERAWMTGLSAGDIAVAVNPASSAAAVEAVCAKLTAAHPAIFRAGPATAPPAMALNPSEGAAAEAIRTAETALAQQNSHIAQLDLQVVTAVLNAHANHAEGVAALDLLQNEIEAAVASRTDLDTPAGARGFQRYLIDKLRDIRTVVDTADLDATSKAALAAALASLYASSSPPSGDVTPPADGASPAIEPHGTPAVEPQSMHSAETGNRTSYPPDPAVPVDLGLDPLPPLSTDPLYSPTDFAPAASAAPPVATMTSPPSPAGWGGGAPASGMPFGGGLPTMPSAALPDFPTEINGGSPHRDASHQTDTPAGDPTGEPDTNGADPTGADPTGAEPAAGEAVTAPSPQLAAVIAAAVAGTSIPDAFSAQGITIPAPDSEITEPVEPTQLLPGDIGLYTDRHALALGNGKALLDGQIQPVDSMTTLGLIGWQHPPEPVTSTPSDVPAPEPPPQMATG